MKYKAGFIGAGNMGGALLRAAAKSVGAENVAFFDPDGEKAAATKSQVGAAYESAEEVCKESRYIFIGVKPNVIASVLSSLKDSVSDDSVIVSMAAGISVSDIEESLGKGKKIIRIMPNTPASVGAGMILWCASESVTDCESADFLKIMECAGKTDKIDEKLIDAAAALSGCGPAFVYMFIEALADGAVACGLPRSKAMLYAEQTVLGSATLAAVSGKHPGELKDAVCSPGGTTIEGVLALENGAFRSSVSSAVISAYEKTAKLKK